MHVHSVLEHGKRREWIKPKCEISVLRSTRRIAVETDVAYLKVLVKPRHSLDEGRLFGESNDRLGDVSSDGKPMLHATEQVDLIRLTRLGQNLLRFVAFRGREDRVGLCVFGCLY
jgi:hypothetical protein